MRKSLTRDDRLSTRGEIRALFCEGRRFKTRGLTIILRPNNKNGTRVLVAPVRGFPNAVQRNRAKRRAREAFRQLKGEIEPGYDVGMILYPADYSSGDRIEQLSRLLEQAGIRRDTRSRHG